jgi:hypothetical protein
MESHPEIIARRPIRSDSAQNVMVIAEGLLLGDDLIVWLLLALGGALFAGNVMALVKPPPQRRQEGDLERAPRSRSILMAAVGFVVAASALAALLVK